MMLDLETMSLAPNAAVVAIGAAVIYEGAITDQFYLTVSLKSCMEYGLKSDASTILWWLKQDVEAQKEIFGATTELDTALVLFSRFCATYNIKGMWGNGVDFDNVILSNAYQAVGMRTPWPYYANRCFRTIKNMYPTVQAKIEDTEIKHHALHDARWQAEYLINLRKENNLL